MTVRIERQGTRAWIRYGNPPRNFLTAEALDNLRRAFCTLDRDPEVRVIGFVGDAPGTFMLHTDMAEIQQMLALVPPGPRVLRRGLLTLFQGVVRALWRWPALARWFLRDRSPAALRRQAMLNMLVLFDAIERSSKVTLAAIDGPCLGGGFELALCCDFRLAPATDIACLGLPEILVGLMPGFGGSQRLVRLVGAARARELLLAGELLSPRRAEQLGLISRLLPAQGFRQSAEDFASRLAQRAPLSVAAVKRAVREGAPKSVRAALFVELDCLSSIAGSADTRQGVERYRRELTRQLALPEHQQPSVHEFASALVAEPLAHFAGR